MLRLKTIFVLFIFMSFSLSCYGETLNYQNKEAKEQLQITSPTIVTSKANNGNSLHASPLREGINFGFTNIAPIPENGNNIIKGADGIYYDPVEQTKVQKEYAQKQFEEK